ncbi:F0F1 ATP synthase subunit gamma [Candidatus Dependentiae bacterium]|nr:F0F1 ATP synthase subunit gamma [Candidatus Dependentiae bacterium]MCC7414481.1 F0F1 ATP synthase subunit gamma [Campylobacterota bacterium]
MSQLIQLRQRIKAIETIKKITHAMRLISMATHTRLKNKHRPVVQYKDSMLSLFKRLCQHAPDWRSPLFFPDPSTNPNHLYIIISSNKGLCGNFNGELFTLLHKRLSALHHVPIRYVLIGKQAIEYKHGIAHEAILLTRADMSANSLESIALACTQLIMQGQFGRVSLIGNVIKTFFKQEARETVLIPFEQRHTEPIIDYNWEQPVEEILPLVAEQYLHAQIYQALFESLFAEQAARFLSMDTATRNARTLLDETQLQYNKTRQLKITKELIELSGGF